MHQRTITSSGLASLKIGWSAGVWSGGMTKHYTLIAILVNDRYQQFRCPQHMMTSSGLTLLIIACSIGLTRPHKLMPATTHFEFSLSLQPAAPYLPSADFVSHHPKYSHPTAGRSFLLNSFKRKSPTIQLPPGLTT